MTEYSIIIPAHNEEKRIRITLINYVNYFRSIGKSFEILVVLNGCKDNTINVVKELEEKYKEINHANFDEAIGKGGALLEGFKLINGNLITYTDADGSTLPETLYELSEKISSYDGIIGSRWIKGAVIIKKQPLTRRIASRGFNILTRIILGLNYKDTQCSAKVFRKNVIDKIKDKVEPTNFAIDAILLYHMKKEGFKIKEEPITWEDKEFSTLRIRKVIPNMFMALIKTKFKK
ncbi:MAG: glycosyltransferase [Nanoarchaeota archaeon]